jgi:hypothetical protein
LAPTVAAIKRLVRGTRRIVNDGLCFTLMLWGEFRRCSYGVGA